VVDPKPVIAFLTEHVPAARGGRADWGDIYRGFREWQAKLGHEVWSATQFGAVLRHICEAASIPVKRQGDRIYCLERRITREVARGATWLALGSPSRHNPSHELIEKGHSEGVVPIARAVDHSLLDQTVPYVANRTTLLAKQLCNLSRLNWVCPCWGSHCAQILFFAVRQPIESGN
jgi:hypothetical protein